jgi:hypothetical protein
MLLMSADLLRDGATPANFGTQYVGDEGWFSFSFNTPYSAAHPALAPVLRGWLRRFDGRAD